VTTPLAAQLGQAVASGCSHRRRRAVHCGFCFLVCNPAARQQGVIEFNRCRNAGADGPISIIVNTSDIIVTSDIINARPSRPSLQLVGGYKGGYKTFLSSLQRSRASTRLG
jgi:hypothetical protein